MSDSLLDVRSRFRSRLASRSALERIGLLAGVFFPAYLIAKIVLGAFPPEWLRALPTEWSTGAFINSTITSVLLGAATYYYLEERAFLLRIVELTQYLNWRNS